MRHVSVHDLIQSSHQTLLPRAWGVYLNELLRRISTQMVGLFIPLYLYKETQQITIIPVYYAIYAGTALLAELPGALTIKRIGVDRGLALGSVFRIIFLYSLIFAKSRHELFYVSAFFFGLTQPFDWLPHYYCLAKSAKAGRRFGSVASVSKLITRIGSTMGPIAGGLCIQLFGFSTLYLLAGVLIIFAGIMPFLDSFEKVGMHVSAKEVLTRLMDPGIFKHLVVFGVEHADNITTTIVWPLFLYKVAGSYSKTGALETSTLLIGAIGYYLVGRLIKRKKYNIMRLGSLALMLGWLGRLGLHTPQGLWAANICYLIGVAFLWTPVWSLLYARSVAKKYTMEFWLVHGILTHSLLLGACLILWVVLSAGIDFVPIIATLILLLGVSLTFPRLYKEYIQRYG